MLNLATDLDLVVAAQHVVHVGGVRAVKLLPPALEEPVASAAGHSQGDGVFDPGPAAIADQGEVVTELACADLEETTAADGAVVLNLAHPGRRVLLERRILGDMLGVAHVSVRAEGLRLDSVLDIGDELVLRSHLIGQLPRVVGQFGQELGAVEDGAGGGLVHDVLLVEVAAPGPELVLDDRTADAGVEVPVVEESVGLRAVEAEGLDDGLGQVGEAASELIGGQVVGLDVLVLILVVQLAGELVTAGLANEVCDDAAARHLGRVTGRAYDHFIERAVVEVEAGR